MKTRDLDKPKFSHREMKTSTSQTKYRVLKISIRQYTYRDVKCSIDLNWRSRGTISKYKFADQFNIQDKQSTNNPNSWIDKSTKSSLKNV